MISHSPRLSIVLISALVSAGASELATAQRLLRIDTGTFTGGQFGSSLDPLGDMNGDGVTDYVSVTTYVPLGTLNLEIRSGADGTLIRSAPGLESTWPVAAIGDVTGDGLADFATGSPEESGGEYGQGVVRLHSGATLAPVQSTFGSSLGVGLGARVDIIGDANADGFDDILTFENERIGISDSRAVVISGADGMLIREHVSPNAWSPFTSAGSVGDLDGDGEADYAVRQPTLMGGIYVYSAATGALLRIFADTPVSEFVSASSPGDLDLDGIPDTLTVERISVGPSSRSRLSLRSGATGAVQTSVTTDVHGEFFGTHLSSRGDFDGDGMLDIVFLRSATGTATSFQDVIVRSGRTLSEIARLESGVPGDRFGSQVEFMGDLDGLPGDELLIGAPRNGPGGSVFIYGYDAGIGSAYCAPQTPNSTGFNGELKLVGSDVPAAGELAFAATGLPPGTFGMGVCSMTAGFSPSPAGSQGDLCVLGAIGRIGLPSLPQSTPFGALTLPLDPLALPTPTVFRAAVAGETWFFQLWYRDSNPGATSNLTNAVELTFN